VADGQVRCGRCHTQFDALERLLEDGDSAAAETGRFLQTSTPAPQRETIDVEEPEESEDITLEGNHIAISGTYRVMDDDDSGRSHLEQEVVEEWAAVDDVDTDVDTEPQNDIDEVHVEPQFDSQVEFEPVPAEEPIRATRAPLGSRAFYQPEYQHESEPETSDELVSLAAQRGPTSARIWSILAIPLALLLVAQVVHHNRSELARHPRLGTPLMSIYQSLGRKLTPDWNLHAYGVKQWGVVMDPSSPGTLKVRASIGNGARFSQPYPFLKLVLEDRWGDQVRAREFEPGEYLDPGVSPDRMLAPGQTTNATVSIVDPGPDAEGFRFDVCLRGRAGVVCAADVPAR
jgi:hypothetical protein